MIRLALMILVVLMGAMAGCSSETEPETASPTSASTTSTMTASTTASSTTSSSAASTTTTAPPTTAAATGPLEDRGSCERPSASSVTAPFEVAGVEYSVRVFLPANPDGDLIPVVLNWHGLGSDGLQQALYTGYEILADSEGFLAVHPTGVEVAGDGRRSWELPQFDVPGRDDVAMAESLIDTLIDEFCADPTRVYSTGMSNGGFFTSRLVCELSDRIAAAVSVAGLTHPDDCEPERTVPFMAFHGTADEVVPFAGGESTLQDGDVPPELADFFDQSMPDEFEQFTAEFGCAEPSSEAVGTGVTVSTSDCGDGVRLVFHEIDGGGHTWPGSPFGALLADQMGATTMVVDATADGWAFMSGYSLDG